MRLIWGESDGTHRLVRFLQATQPVHRAQATVSPFVGQSNNSISNKPLGKDETALRERRDGP